MDQAYLELLPLLEGEASLADLLAPAAALVRVANHRVLVPVRVEARIDVHGDVRLAGADVHHEAAAKRRSGFLLDLCQFSYLQYHKGQTCIIDYF